ncbi:MAG: sugar-phosphatase [Ktedonobacteraceae bacterium]
MLDDRNDLHTLPTSIKMLVIDLDGTLLNPEGKITSATIKSVQMAQEAGIVVTLATARRYCNTAKIASELLLAGPIILYDGAEIVQHPQGSILYTRPIEAQIAQEAVNVLVRHGVQPVVHPNDGQVEEVWTELAEQDSLELNAYFEVYRQKIRRMPYQNLCAGNSDPLRVVAFTSEEAIQRVIPEIATLPCSWTMIKRGSYGCAELVVMDKGCTKASGVAALAQVLSIPMSEVMAIGDNNNDIAMLQAAGWGVAMGQAAEHVKAAADAVTTSNAEDGVAQAIERYVLRNTPQLTRYSRGSTSILH